MSDTQWKPLLIDVYEELDSRFESLSRALDFFHSAMSKPDQCGTQRDAIDWLREAAEEVRDSYWSYKLSEQKRVK